jgi:phosphoglycerate dehydrogenase-like enzyme
MARHESRPLVLVTEGSSAAPLEWLHERAEVLIIAPGQAGFEAALSRASGLVVRTYTKVNEALLAAAPQLEVVGRGGVGLENIDVAACRRRGVQVVYTPDANTQAVAEFVTGLMLKLVRPWFENSQGLFVQERFKQMREQAGEQLGDLVLGILGMGRVGRAVARVAHDAFSMRVLYHDVENVSSAVHMPAVSVSLEGLLAGCDILSVHVDARVSNRHFIDADLLSIARCRWLINTSRGMVIDPGALAPALSTGPILGLAMDVFDPEPPTAGSAYAKLLADWPDRVILTPHMASRTTRALENMSWVVRDIIAVIEGREPQWPAPEISSTGGA